MKKELKVLTLQFEPVLGNKDKNLKKVAQLLKDNADFEADLVVLPEVWNTGFDYKNIEQSAEYIPYHTTMLLSSLAESYNTNIIAGSILEKTSDGKFYNTSMVLNRTGAVTAYYRKNHIFSHHGSQEGEFIEAGNETCVVEIDGIKYGIAICYDIRFPELFRKMVKEGAEIFVVPAAFPQERIDQWNILNQARALENLSFLISCNQFGSSNVISPLGKVLRTSNKGEQAIRNIIALDEITITRGQNPFLNDIK